MSLQEDSGLPKCLCGELVLTAVYLAKTVRKVALGNVTYKALFGKGARVGHVRVVGTRVLVHIDAHTKKPDDITREGRLVGFSARTARPTASSTNQSKGVWSKQEKLS